MPVDDRFIRALTEISPDLAEQYLRQYHPTEATLRPNSTMPRQFSTPVESSLTKPLVESAMFTFSQAQPPRETTSD